MNKLKWLSIFSLLLIFVCTNSQAEEVKLGVDFSWEGISRCSNHSPEIKVTNIPEETTSFKVRLDDLDAPSWNHGGGTADNDGSGIIPAGSLKRGYNGPCPPSGSHQYRFTVYAKNAKGKTIGKGKATKSFP
jgi:phosphatidylethanolamine-binding protein (PEBP) family uncharacterized protein